jgi:hypothetical protein
VLTHERLDLGGAVHVRDGDHPEQAIAGQGRVDRPPRLPDVVLLGHARHRTGGGHVRQDDLHAVVREHVGGLGHEVHTAEDDVLRSPAGRLLGRHPAQLEAVAGQVGVANDRLLLVVVSQDEQVVTKLVSPGLDGVGELRVGPREILIGEAGLPLHRRRTSGFARFPCRSWYG